MNILVCFKVVPDLDLMPGGDWNVDSRLRVETGYVKNIINPYDESALEIALQFADKADDDQCSPGLTALTIGDSKANLHLKTLRALSFDRAVRIDSKEDLRFRPETCAALISAYINKIGKNNVVIMGRQSGVGDNAQTPLICAEMMGWPCITQVSSIEPAAGACLRVTNLVDDGTCRQTIEPPCILAIGNAPNSYLRVPTLKDIKAHGQKPVEVIDAAVLMATGGQPALPGGCELLGIEAIDRRRSGIIIEVETAAEKTQALYYSYLKGWLAGI